MSILRRIFKAGLLNFIRNGVVSFSAVLVMVVTLSVITTLVLLQATLNFSLNQIKEKVDVTIYFVPKASEEKILALKNSLEKLPEISDVSYTSAEEALVLFQEKHAKDYATIQALEEIRENPLGGYLNIKAKEVSQYESIASFLSSDNILVRGSSNIIDKVNYFQNRQVIERLNSIIKGAERFGFILTMLLIIISIIVTYNTIRLTIFISREEIGIMRLVGASKSRVRAPFMIEGAIYGVLASLITILIFWPITKWVGNNMTNFLGIDLYDYFLSNILPIFLMLFVSGVLLGIISSFFAIRKYLNK